MKKIIFISLLLLSILRPADAQFTKIGGGFGYGTGFHFNNETGALGNLHRSPTAGIYLKGVYEINLSFHISPSFTYFFPRTNKSTASTFNAGDTRVSSMMFDLNSHYVFNSLDRFEFYGLAGINITFAKIKWLDSPSSGSDNGLGLNVGAGTYIKVTEKFDISSEVKYIISKYGQLMLNAGVMMNIDWMKKHEKSPF